MKKAPKKARKNEELQKILDHPLDLQVAQHVVSVPEPAPVPFEDRKPFRGVSMQVGQTRWAPSTVKGPDGLNDFEREWLQLFKQHGDPELAAHQAYRLDTLLGKTHKELETWAAQLAKRNLRLLKRFYQDRWERLGITDSLVHGIIVDAAAAVKTGVNQRTGEVTISTIPDHDVRMKAAKLAVELRGLKAPTKAVVDHNHQISSQLSSVLKKLDVGDVVIDVTPESQRAPVSIEELEQALGGSPCDLED